MTFPPPRRGLENVVDTEDHLCSLAGANDDLSLELVALRHTEIDHASDLAFIEVQPGVLVAIHVRRAKLRDELAGIETCIVRKDGRKLPQGSRERFRSNSLLARRLARLLVHFRAHCHLCTAAAERHARLFDGLREDRERIV